jgi:hypothetical protein
MTTTGGAGVDPFERIRRDLVAAAARRRDRTRRRRRLALLAALPVLLIAGTAGAAAVGDFSTGVPAIDGLLANEDGSGPLGSDVRPGPGGASESLRLPSGADGRDAAAVAYLSRDGLVCKARGDFRRWDGAPRGSYGGCLAPADLARMLSRRTVYCCASEHGPERRIYDGFAAGDVVALRLLMEDGATVEAKLTPPWTPAAPGAEPLRLFVAVDERDIDVGGDGVQMDESHLIMGGRFRMEATLRDGRTVAVRSPFDG